MRAFPQLQSTQVRHGKTTIIDGSCRLTIVTVTRNCAATIDATLRSVAQVKRGDIEYLVIDGTSTDGTLERLRGAGTLVDRLVSEPDTGIYNAMNKAVGLARGRYILFINGDDELLPDGFEAAVATLETLEAEILCAVTLVGSAQNPTERLIAEPWKLIFFNSVPHPSAFTPTALLRRFPFREDLKIASDYDFFLRSFLTGVKFRRLAVATALHQRGGASNNISVAVAELTQVRKVRLGAFYPLSKALHAIYRTAKRRVQLGFR